VQTHLWYHIHKFYNKYTYNMYIISIHYQIQTYIQDIRYIKNTCSEVEISTNCAVLNQDYIRFVVLDLFDVFSTASALFSIQTTFFPIPLLSIRRTFRLAGIMEWYVTKAYLTYIDKRMPITLLTGHWDGELIQS